VEITITSGVTRTLQKIVEEVERMSPKEYRQSLVHAGILNEDGTLTEMYKRRK
jgi:hypothetical protein